MRPDVLEVFIRLQVEELTERAIDHSLRRLRRANIRVEREDLGRLIRACIESLGKSPFEPGSRDEMIFWEFFKFFKKYLEDRLWYPVWRMFKLRGVRVRKVLIADIMGGEVPRSGRGMGRDIDYLVVVDSDYEEAQRIAPRVEELINRSIGEKMSEIAGASVSEEALRTCKFFNLVEIDVFADEEEARAWRPTREIGRVSYIRVRARELLHPSTP